MWKNYINIFLNLVICYVIVATNVSNSLECQYMSAGQPDCTYQCGSLGATVQ